VSSLTTDRIRDHASKLGLIHLSDTIIQLVDRAETAQMGYLDFVDLLLEEEVGLREGRRFRNALKLSGLPHQKTLDEFDFAFQPGLDARKIRDLASSNVGPARMLSQHVSEWGVRSPGLVDGARPIGCLSRKAGDLNFGCGPRSVFGYR
jgi:hypothetical protein